MNNNNYNHYQNRNYRTFDIEKFFRVGANFAITAAYLAIFFFMMGLMESGGSKANDLKSILTPADSALQTCMPEAKPDLQDAKRADEKAIHLYEAK